MTRRHPTKLDRIDDFLQRHPGPVWLTWFNRGMTCALLVHLIAQRW